MSVHLPKPIVSLQRRTLRWAASGVRLPRYTVRLRLTLMYGCVFLVCGAGLLAITYLLVRSSTSSVLYVKGPNGVGVIAKKAVGPIGAGSAAGGEGSAGGAGGEGVEGAVPQPGPQTRLQLPNGAQVTPSPQQLEELHRQGEALMVQARSQHDAELSNLLEESGIALAIMAVVSMGLGWLLAGRVLHPLQTITSAARAISASNLHERLALEGPDDELRELGDTFDGLLARLEASFESQRQFVANASHELRTPLTVERALLEVALADPAASTESLRHACERVLASSEEQERLIEALLTLASSERGLEHRAPLDLGAVVAETVRATTDEARLRGVRVTSTLAAAPTLGDPRLVARLARNLVDNALRYNVPAGHVEVTTATRVGGAEAAAGGVESRAGRVGIGADGVGTGAGGVEPWAGRAGTGAGRVESRAGRVVLTVANTGPTVPPGEVARLLQPFQRLGAGRTAAHGEGHGLGLSIVQAIATAHGATLAVHPQPQGGLRIEVAFPLATPAPRAADVDERVLLLQ